MGLVYVYLAAWIAGGVLLGANMLLGETEEELEAPLPAPRTPARVAAQLASLGLIGFGLGGLGAEGLGLVNAPYTVACAVLGAALIGSIGYVAEHAGRQTGA
jgi:hypothetical protein